MRIGELAAECDCSVETIRYYEKVGLLSKPERAENGYRTYTENQLKWLQFILRCRRIGLTQDEIRQLADIETKVSAKCDEVNELLTQHLVNLHRKLDDLKQMEKSILRLKNKCEKGTLGDCLVIVELMK
ncbi:MAG: MerR family transcriptional regulator [Gammaproteobacteria bacterium]|nr:MerR family transcriptional regulator [Gammaproteobacteria bacterium]